MIGFDMGAWLEETDLLHQDVDFEIEEWFSLDDGSYDKRSMRLKMCGTPRRYVNGQGRISKFVMRCKLPECKDCEKWRLEETIKDLKEARHKLGVMRAFYTDMDDKEMKAFFRKHESTLRDYGRYPQEDGSTLLVMPALQVEGIDFNTSRFISCMVNEHEMYKSPDGLRRSGNLVNFRAKNRDEDVYSDESYVVEVPIIEIERGATDKDIALSEVIAVAGSSDFTLYDKPEDLILERNRLLYESLQSQGFDVRYINKVEVRVEPSMFWHVCPTISEIVARNTSTSRQFKTDDHDLGWKILKLELSGREIAT